MREMSQLNSPPARRPFSRTLRYLAPELRAGGEATPAADQYAFAVALTELPRCEQICRGHAP